MEALPGATQPSMAAEVPPAGHRLEAASSLLKPSRLCCTYAYSRSQESLEASRLCARRCGCRVRALQREVPGGSAWEEEVLGIGFASVGERGASFLIEDNWSQNGSLGRNHDEKSDLEIHDFSGSGTSGGSRAGLFRTPISGGVQSATSAHGLPRPALAVRNLMEQARFAHLCTVMSRMHHRRDGYPFGSLVDFATDSMGHPIFSLSPLAIHTRNLLADPRCTLVVQIPGWSGLSNARVTIFGDILPLPADQQECAHKQYVTKHQQWATQQWGNFYYYRMQNISDIYFIGGFGTVAWVDVQEYEALRPDKIAVNGGEQNLKELNAVFSKPLKEMLSTEGEIDDAALISIDSKGTDIRVRQGAQFNIQRLSFEEDHEVETLDEAKAALQKIIDKSCSSSWKPCLTTTYTAAEKGIEQQQHGKLPRKEKENNIYTKVRRAAAYCGDTGILYRAKTFASPSMVDLLGPAAWTYCTMHNSTLSNISGGKSSSSKQRTAECLKLLPSSMSSSSLWCRYF
ncbi:hypothetical protein Taro_051952 [Colocasia esculenta]|uniref:CREG-like beta-barrel domain-containing protein n=1 Tax=Colocasia esculenta TaxID=4460 RepID=A0A843XI79_COLES|nr:hypothetical protein [Colocasia esculenta]